MMMPEEVKRRGKWMGFMFMMGECLAFMVIAVIILTCLGTFLQKMGFIPSNGKPLNMWVDLGTAIVGLTIAQVIMMVAQGFWNTFRKASKEMPK